MASVSWKIDPLTRDYVLAANGSPSVDLSLGTPSLVRLGVKRGQWLHAPDAEYGSTLYTLNRRVASPVEVVSSAQSALQPLVADGRAESVNVQLTGVARGDVRVEARVVDDQGRPQVFQFNPIMG